MSATSLCVMPRTLERAGMRAFFYPNDLNLTFSNREKGPKRIGYASHLIERAILIPILNYQFSIIH